MADIVRHPGAARQWALRLARLGFKIFPIPEGSKTPALKEWQKIATTDESRIVAWFNENPRINYGANPPDGAFVLDLDDKAGKQGTKELLFLEQDQDLDNWVTSSTLTVRSPSGGSHLYLVGAEYAVSNANRFPDGIDVRGSGGYVVGPGCELIEGLCDAKDTPGQYTVIVDTDVKEAPGWVKARLKKFGEKEQNTTRPLFDLDQPFAIERAREFLKKRTPAIEGLNGNDHTYATAQHLKDFGLSEKATVQLLMTPVHENGKSWNDTCIPPWPLTELKQVVENAYEYGQRRPGSKGGGVMEMFDGEEDLTPEGQIDDRFKHLRDITFPGMALTKRNKKREMVIPEWLPAHGYTILLAKRGGGKTTVMTDLALRVANDMDWHNLPVKEGMVVLYVVGEDDEGLEVQIRAWLKHHGRTLDDTRFIVMAGIVDLLSAESTQMWTEYLRSIIPQDKRVLLCIDTWQRATSRGGQNNDEEMQVAVHHAEAMARSLNGPAIIAFHPPKHDARVVMGSSVIENASTAIWRMEDNTAGKKLIVDRIKGPGTDNFQIFAFEEVKVGELDEFRNEVTGIIPYKVSGTESVANAEEVQRLDKVKAVYADVIRELLSREMRTGEERRTANVNFMSEQISNLKTGDRLKKMLEDVGEVKLSQSNVNRRITELFVRVSLPFEFNDGCLLCLVKKDGRQRVFEVRAAPEPEPEV